MRNLRNILALSVATLGLLASCNKNTEIEAKDPVNLTQPKHTEDYYQSLREYKNSDHQIAFSYYSGWTGVGASMQSSMMGLPDSIDLISIWGGWKNPSEAQIKDLREAQQKKGLKAMICFLVLDMGAQITPDPTEAEKASLAEGELWRHKFWGWKTGTTDEDKAARRASVVKYANAICDTIYKYGYDGFDIDAEPTYSHPFETEYELWRLDKDPTTNEPTLFNLFVETIAKRVGPKAETEEGRKKVLAIDGEADALPLSQLPYFNYFIVQAYNDEVGANNQHFRGMVTKYIPTITAEELCKRSIFVVDFESGATRGGKVGTGQILKFALQQPEVNGTAYRKGGVGAFRVDLEYNATVDDYVDGIDMASVKGKTYPWLRRAIQLMNPIIY